MTTHNLHSRRSLDEASPIHRIGSVSRMVGIPVSTLRMWESRYAAFAPGKTGGRHRLYSDEDVVRARVLRQLTEAGHSIGGIAQLPLQRLQEMLTNARSRDPEAAPRAPLRLAAVVVGAALATRLQSGGWRGRLGSSVLDIRATFMSIEEACTEEARASLSSADILLARVNALQPSVIESLVKLKADAQVRNALLLYNFGAQAGVEALRQAGFLVRREPIDDAELAELLRSSTWAQARTAPRADAADAAIPARRYGDEELARIAAATTKMLCECPRHLADIIAQLSSFEEYSRECLNDSDEDAQVHARLRSVAGSARAMFEDALAAVIAHEAGKQTG